MLYTDLCKQIYKLRVKLTTEYTPTDPIATSTDSTSPMPTDDYAGVSFVCSKPNSLHYGGHCYRVLSGLNSLVMGGTNCTSLGMFHDMWSYIIMVLAVAFKRSVLTMKWRYTRNNTCMIIGSKMNLKGIYHFTIKVNNIIFVKVISQKILSVNVNCNLSWHTHWFCLQKS